MLIHCNDDRELLQGLDRLYDAQLETGGVRLMGIEADFVFGTIPTTIRLCSGETILSTNLKGCKNLRPFARLIASREWVKIGDERDIDHIAFFCGDLGKKNVFDSSLLEKLVGEACSTNEDGEESHLKMARLFEAGKSFFVKRRPLRIVTRGSLPHKKCHWATSLPKKAKSFVFSMGN